MHGSGKLTRSQPDNFGVERAEWVVASALLRAVLQEGRFVIVEEKRALEMKQTERDARKERAHLRPTPERSLISGDWRAPGFDHRGRELRCPKCKERHVEPEERWFGKVDPHRPHRTHVCSCGHRWRVSTKSLGLLPGLGSPNKAFSTATQVVSGIPSLLSQGSVNLQIDPGGCELMEIEPDYMGRLGGVLGKGSADAGVQSF